MLNEGRFLPPGSPLVPVMVARPKPDYVESTPALSEGLKAASSGQLFADIIRPTLRASSSFSRSHTQTLPNELVSLVASPENRAIVWAHLEYNGIRGLSEAERGALVAVMMPYVHEDASYCWNAVVSAVRGLVEVKDHSTYHTIGNAVLSCPPPPEIADELLAPFASLLVYNVGREPFVKPWVEFFSQQNDPELFSDIVISIMDRLDKGDLSSYEHLIDVLCCSRSPAASEKLELAVSLHKILAEEFQTPPCTLRSRAAAFAVETAIMLPGPLLLATLIGGSNLYYIGIAIGSALAFGALSVRLGEDMIAAENALQLEEELASLRARPYMTFVQNIYSRLSDLRETNESARAIAELIENDPFYSENIGGWRESIASKESRTI